MTMAEETEQLQNAEESRARTEQNLEWIRRAQAGDEAALERLVTENRGLVRSMAARFRDCRIEMEDLLQIGTVGMLRAIRSFDVERGNAFSTYAVPLIIGEIRRHLRDDGIIRVSRTYKRLGVLLMRERSRILMEEGREPVISELAALCGTTSEEAAVALDAISPVTSLSDPVFGDESVTYEGVLPDEEGSDEMERITDRVALAQALSRMDPAWRRIVMLRYERGMTQQETAEELGLSQVRVSREEKKIMTHLRRELLGEVPD